MPTIGTLYNSTAILCPQCGYTGTLEPVGGNGHVDTPQEAWGYPFKCHGCHKTYELGKVALKRDMYLFDQWFSRKFPSEPKPWETVEKLTTANASSPKDFESMYKSRRDKFMRRALGFD